MNICRMSVEDPFVVYQIFSVVAIITFASRHCFMHKRRPLIVKKKSIRISSEKNIQSLICNDILNVHIYKYVAVIWIKYGYCLLSVSFSPECIEETQSHITEQIQAKLIIAMKVLLAVSLSPFL